MDIVLEHMDGRQTTDTFLKMYDELADALFRHCLFRVYDKERARELMQECFTRTWEQIAKGKEIQNLKAFLYRVANNLVIDEARKKKEVSLEVLMESGFEPGDLGHISIETAADARAVIAVMHTMDESIRDVIVMRYIDGLGPKDIAQITGESENVISVRLHRGLRKVQEEIEKQVVKR